jgi:putative transposase
MRKLETHDPTLSFRCACQRRQNHAVGIHWRWRRRLLRRWLRLPLKRGVRLHETAPNTARRRSLRLKDFDYSTSALYFVTVCTSRRKPLLANIVAGRLQPSAIGRVVSECWFELPYHYSRLELGAFVVMPNHIHGLMLLRDPVGAGLRPAPTTATLSQIVGAFKSFSSRRIHESNASTPRKVWQRGFHERIVRNRNECTKIEHYILQNPARWEFDRENSRAQKHDDPDPWES